nr:SGNH/GDSL hydrolase family protein [Neobacillus sp. Marseille-Q6967]
MKNFLTVLLGIVCITVLVIGNSYWNKKIQQASAKITSVETGKLESKENNQDVADIETAVLALASNWPAAAVERFKQTLDNKEAFKILFVGSSAIGSETDGMYPIVRQKLIESFGEKNIEIGIKTFDTTSSQLIANNFHEEIAAEAADLVVIEPLTLNDNGNVSIEESLNNISALKETILTQNPAATLIIQPSYPLFNAKFYPIQVEEVKKYAESNQIPYLDHWAAWPDPNTEDVKTYLLPDQTGPSEQGIQAWSDYLIQFFINSEGESN